MSRWQTAITRAKQFDPRSVPGLALWLDGADTSTLYTTDAGAVTAVTAPTDIGGCVLWLDASDAATVTTGTYNGATVVTHIVDKTTNARVFNQPTFQERRPTYVSNARNGRNVMRYGTVVTGQERTAIRCASSATFAQPSVWIYAYQTPTTSSGAYGLLDVEAGGTRNFIYGNSGPEIRIGTSSADQIAASSQALSEWRISSFTFNGLTSRARNAGATIGSVSIGTESLSGNIVIGNNNGFTIPHRGDIGEVICFSPAPSDADLARVEAYLAAKWGISGVHAQATATSDPVGQWRDKSGNGRHFTQSVGSNRASRAAAVNGRPVVGFNGTSSQLTLSNVTNADLADASGAASFVVFRPDGDSTYSVFSNSAAGSHRDRFSDNSSYPASFRGSRLESIINGAMPTTALSILGHSVNSADSAHVILLNGASVHTAAPNFTGTSSLWRGQTGVTYRIGNGPTADFLSGVVCEVMQYGTALNASARQRIERYLATKWGITLAPQVSNADAQDWINRVYANGGQVSSSTASAVNTLCNSIDAAGIRDRFYRMGIFAGSNLAAALVPLYRGPSLGGTQYGNATDTNVGPFVSGDYAENNGLLGNASSKYLNTGFDASVAGLTTGSVHMSAIWPAYTQPANNSYQSVSITNSAINERFWISAFANTTPITAVESFLGQSGTFFVRDTIASTNGAAVSGGLWTASRTSLSSMRLYNGSTQKAENTSTVASAALPSTAMTVFVRWNGTAFFGYSAQRLRGYSVGLGMDDSQVGAFNSAMSAFQSALGRT